MLTKQLYPYQREPLERFLARGSLLVAYEMGLGKTPIAIACAEELRGCGDITTALVICPASLKYQWAQRIAEFTDLPTTPHKIKDEIVVIPRPEYCTVIDGAPQVRRLQYHNLIHRSPAYIIMSYENVISATDSRYIRNLGAGLVILDECTAIKTFKAKRTRKIKQVLASEFRLGLTGTPVENKPEELFSIMQWVDGSVLGRYDLFDRAYILRDHFGRVRAYRNLPVLRRKLAPAISRKSRLDPDVAPYLPDVDYGTWTVSMDTPLRDKYKEIAADLYAELKALPVSGNFDLAAYYAGHGDGDSTALGKVMARQMALEMLLDHPSLLRKSAQDFQDSQDKRDAGDTRKEWPGSSYAHTLCQNPLPDSTPKLDILTEKVSGIINFDDRNKILIFTRFRGMLDLLEERLDVPCVQYHGGMNVKEKAAAIARFSGDSRARIFLSSHAGAYGNDMRMANYLINYDLAWSAGRADQINGRHVRASSQFSQVYIRDMITEGTVEQRRRDMLTIKRRVGSAILDGHGQDADGRVTNDLNSLLNHLTSVLHLY